MRYLVTGGLGYLGSHLVRSLISEKHEVFIVDDLSKGVLARNIDNANFINENLGDPTRLSDLIQTLQVSGVFHLAASKSVSESIRIPDFYYSNNVQVTSNLIQAAITSNLKNIVFTSSAAVYGNLAKVGKILEHDPVNPINPYGETKFICEGLLKNASIEHGINVASLRVFNIAGVADPLFFEKSGENVIPKIIDSVLNGQTFEVFGRNLPTFDGTPTRDFIHVTDVVNAHVQSMTGIEKTSGGEHHVLNVSSGQGTSVLNLIQLVEDISGQKVKYDLSDARVGEPAQVIGDNSKLMDSFSWSAKESIHQMVTESWNARISSS